MQSNFRGLAEHYARTAVFRLGKPDGIFDGFGRNIPASHEIRHLDIRVNLWRVLGPNSLYSHLQAAHHLTLFLQDIDYVHSGAACQAKKQKLHRAGTMILAAPFDSGIQRQTMFGARRALKFQPFHPPRFCRLDF